MPSSWDVVAANATSFRFAGCHYYLRCRLFRYRSQSRRLVTGWPAMQPYVRALFQPELFEYPTEDTVGTTPILIPCIDPCPPGAVLGSSDPILTTVEPCAAVGDTITIVGSGMNPL